MTENSEPRSYSQERNIFYQGAPQDPPSGILKTVFNIAKIPTDFRSYCLFFPLGKALELRAID